MRIKASKERDCDMCNMFRDGIVLEEIGNKYNITRERVRQILRRHGLTRFDGGQHVITLQKKQKQDALRKERRTKRAAKYGVTLEVFDKLAKRVSSHAMARFREIRWHVSAGTYPYKKGVEWDLTLLDYANTWEKAGLEPAQRGYYFARKDLDKGYVKDNMQILTAGEFGSRTANLFGFIAHPENTTKRKAK